MAASTGSMLSRRSVPPIKNPTIFDGRTGTTSPIRDETDLLFAWVQSAEETDGFTMYRIRVQWGYDSPSEVKDEWLITRRYSEFLVFHQLLCHELTDWEFELPPKRLMKKKKQVVAERLAGLQEYIDAVLSVPTLNYHPIVRNFLVPERYSAAADNDATTSFQQVSMCLRNIDNWREKKVSKTLHQIGWRPSKHYFLVEFDSYPKCGIVTWSKYGPDRNGASAEDIALVLERLRTMTEQHPYLCPPVYACCDDAGALTVRPLMVGGSIRDQVFQKKYNESFLTKIGKPSMEFADVFIRTMGRQILEALRFMHQIGLPYGQLHPGNIVWMGSWNSQLIDRFQLLDIEGGVLGHSPMYRQNLIRSPAKTCQEMDVYCFGVTMVELLSGDSTMTMRDPGVALDECPPRYRSLLTSIVASDTLPTVDDLINHDLFRNISVERCASNSIRIPRADFDTMLACRNRIESRLQRDRLRYETLRKNLKMELFLRSDKANVMKIKKMKEKQATLDEQRSLQLDFSPRAQN